MDKEFYKLIQDKSELTVRYDPKNAALWTYTNPQERPNYSLNLIKEYRQLQLDIIKYFKNNNMNPKVPINYLVSASQIPDIYNYGGDLNHFVYLIRNKDDKKLYEYAEICVDISYMNATGLGLPLTTIALIEGDALGGGFEAAIAHQITISENQCEFGLPEIRFNLFPGMGAYSFLARLVGIKKAEEIITSGKNYSADSLFDIGVITKVVKKKEGEKAVRNFMRRHSKAFNGMQAIQKSRYRYSPIDYNELIDITKIWVDAALKLSEKDLKMMKRIVDAQSKNYQKIEHRLRTKQDRRINAKHTEFPLLDADGNPIESDRRKRPDPRKKSEEDQ